ncbi:MAG: polyprenyl synthetase family protein [Candidatus Woesearchaeota archaeon]
MKELMQKYKQMIDSRLEAFFEERLRRAGRVASVGAEALETLKDFSLKGGKRIRPMLCIFSYKGFGGSNERAIVDAAIAIELMESYLLIHDDIIDQDDLRRGYLTVHKVYEAKSKDQHYGTSMAIVVGDIAAALGSEAILNAEFQAKKKILALEKFNRVIVNTCFGQMLDIKSEREQVTEEDVLRIHALKTAVYTIEGPLHIGALLAGASQKQLEKLSDFAMPLGKAFQLQDDILGLFGARQRIGKPVGSDIREGKKTILVLKALEKVHAQERKFLLHCLGNKSITEKEVHRVQDIVKSTGSLEYSQRLMQAYLEHAQRALKSTRMNSQGRKFLEYIAQYIANRDK